MIKYRVGSVLKTKGFILQWHNRCLLNLADKQNKNTRESIRNGFPTQTYLTTNRGSKYVSHTRLYAININKHARSAARTNSMHNVSMSIIQIYPFLAKLETRLALAKHISHRRSQLFPSGSFCMQMESPSRFLARVVTRACRFYRKRAPDRKKERD